MQLAPPAIEIDRRIEHLMHVKALCGVLEPGRERRFKAIMASARTGVTGADPAALTAALDALGLLSLELCDE